MNADGWVRAKHSLAVSLARVTHHRWRLTWALVGLALLSIFLGVVGWIDYARSGGGGRADVLTVTYGTLGLFAFVPDVEGAPWPLAVARITAPITTVGVALAALLVFADNRIHREAAATATEHLALLGSSDRVGPYLAASAEVVGERGTVVHLDTDEAAAAEQPEPGVSAGTPGSVARVRVGVLASPFAVRPDPWDSAIGSDRVGWITAANVGGAAASVIATGVDRWNVEALGAALSASLPADGRTLTVEIDDRSTALRLAVAFAVDPPVDGDVLVVCRDEVLARLAVDRLLAVGSESGSALAIVGDGPMVPLVAMDLGRRLEDASLGNQESDSVATVHLVDPDPNRASRLRARIHSGRLHVIEGHEPNALIDDPGGLICFVDFADPDRTIRFALELASSNLRHAVVGLFGRGPLPFGERLHSLDGREHLRARDLVDPFTRAARITNEAARGGRSVSAATLRAMTGELVRSGWAVVPSVGTEIPAEIDRSTKSRLVQVASAGPGGGPDGGLDGELLAEDLTGILRSVGLTVVAPA